MSDVMAPQIAFLGIAERASQVQEGTTGLVKWNVLGLRHVVLTFITPLSMQGWQLGVSVRGLDLDQQFVLKIVSSSGDEQGVIKLGFAPVAEDAAPLTRTGLPVGMSAFKGWTTLFFALPEAPVIKQPGSYHVVWVKEDESSEVIGEFSVLVVEPMALTPERVAAIKSDPGSAKAVRIQIGCKSCESKLTVYASVERSKKIEEEGAIWYQDAPDSFGCSCGSTNLDLAYVRRNLPGLIGGSMSAKPELSFVPTYERSSLEDLERAFSQLLDKSPDEEELQKFIAANPVLLHRFPAIKFFAKPPILTRYRADFAIVTPHQELLVVEIETSKMKLHTKSGEESARLGHAFRQIQDWLGVIDDHRTAFLSELKIAPELVASVRGLVVAGRDKGCDAAHLRRIKANDRGRVSLLTFDDLLYGLRPLIENMRGM